MKHDQTAFSARVAYTADPAQRIEQFRPMVRKLAWFYDGSAGAAIDVDDLMQAGMIALVECARRHDRPSDDGFAAYAKMRVRGSMIDLIRASSHQTRGLRRWVKRAEAARHELRGSLRREPSAREMAAALEQSLEDYEAMRLEAAGSIGSIEEHFSDSDMAFRDDRPDAEARLLDAGDAEALGAAIAQLPERLQLVLQLHFYEGLNLTEIAATLDVSVPRVHQLKAAAVKKLRLELAPG